MDVFCDFDGTVTRADSTDVVLSRLALPEWEAIEEAWVGGRISAADCMRRQIALLPATNEALGEVLDSIDLDPSFGAFADWCESRRIPITIVSDGVDYFIRKILSRFGLDHLPVIANVFAGDRTSGRRLEQIWRRHDCASEAGVCKCWVLRRRRCDEAPNLTVYVGDGRSDFCVASKTDLLFAKGKLAEFAKQRGIDHWHFGSFHDVRRVLSRMLDRAPAADVPARSDFGSKCNA